MPDINYEITQHLSTLSTSSRGWTKELNLVSWNGRAPKYDIRDWAPEYARMGKGVTLSEGRTGIERSSHEPYSESLL